MYDLAEELMAASGYVQYEISNFAKPEYECRHNLCYWTGEEYVAYGPGAVERVGRRRWTHIKHPERYCDAVETEAGLSCQEEILSDEELRLETVMLGLRLNAGLELQPSRFAQGGVERALASGYIVLENGTVRLTAMGRKFCNQAVLQLA
jgi:oxygen-independent coproporphyrinogen-3 oxidase